MTKPMKPMTCMCCREESNKLEYNHRYHKWLCESCMASAEED